MTAEELLIAGIGAVTTALVSVVVALWACIIRPLVNKMLGLVETMQQEQPKQTKALEEQSESLRSINHSSAEHLRLQKEEMSHLEAIKSHGEKAAAELAEHRKWTQAAVANLRGVLDKPKPGEA